MKINRQNLWKDEEEMTLVLTSLMLLIFIWCLCIGERQIRLADERTKEWNEEVVLEPILSGLHISYPQMSLICLYPTLSQSQPQSHPHFFTSPLLSVLLFYFYSSLTNFFSFSSKNESPQLAFARQLWFDFSTPSECLSRKKEERRPKWSEKRKPRKERFGTKTVQFGRMIQIWEGKAQMTC